MRLVHRLFLVVLILGVGATTTRAQSTVSPHPKPGEPTPAGRGPLYGAAGLTTWTATAFDFSTFSQSVTWSPVGGSPDRYLTSGFFEVPVHLPQGSSVEIVEIEGCDNSASGQLSATFALAVSPAGGGLPVATVSTGVAATPGCNFFQVPVSPALTVDNQNNVYWFEMTNSPTDGTTYYAAARVYYRLQVSPAPGTATFTDVPTTHPQFQFVEALVAAGITGGCGGGNYCPDAPLTRGQMAVFLSAALGLHWPN